MGVFVCLLAVLECLSVMLLISRAYSATEQEYIFTTGFCMQCLWQVMLSSVWLQHAIGTVSQDWIIVKNPYLS